MDTPDLAALVPGLMSSHPAFEWTLVAGTVPGDDLQISVFPTSAPDRTATIVVLAGAQVFTAAFAGHVSTDHAYDDGARPEALQGRIELAVAATTGPTRVILERAGDAVLASTLVLDPESSSARQDTKVTWPLRRLKARLRGRRIVPEVLDFPEVPSA